MDSPNYLPYTPDLEIVAPDEHVTFDEISRVMQHITRHMAARYRHAYRPVHAKSHGVLVGTLDVLQGLPEPLAQGLFARPAAYPVVMRISTNPGDMLADTISSPRGLALKVLNVPGAKVANHAGGTTQDFVCINIDALPTRDPKAFLAQVEAFDKVLDTPEAVKHAVSAAARAANTALKAVHLPSATLEGIGASATHMLGETFTTVSPLRYGRYVAKLAFMPGSDSLRKLTGQAIDLGADYNALAELIKHFFRHETAVWEVKAQLALAPERPGVEDFPIEAADIKWPVEKSPWQTVARITAPPQDSYSDPRQLFVDERLSFTPWHALEAHRPLGGIMRSRLKAYEEAAKYRAQRNERERAEPADIAEVPA